VASARAGKPRPLLGNSMLCRISSGILPAPVATSPMVPVLSPVASPATVVVWACADGSQVLGPAPNKTPNAKIRHNLRAIDLKLSLFDIIARIFPGACYDGVDEE